MVSAAPKRRIACCYETLVPIRVNGLVIPEIMPGWVNFVANKPKMSLAHSALVWQT